MWLGTSDSSTSQPTAPEAPAQRVRVGLIRGRAPHCVIHSLRWDTFIQRRQPHHVRYGCGWICNPDAFSIRHCPRKVAVYHAYSIRHIQNERDSRKAQCEQFLRDAYSVTFCENSTPLPVSGRIWGTGCTNRCTSEIKEIETAPFTYLLIQNLVDIDKSAAVDIPSRDLDGRKPPEQRVGRV